MQKENPSYYAIIPAHVRYAKVTAGAKLLYGELTALTNKEGYCWATNAYFAELYEVSADTISRWVKELKDSNFISSELVYKENSKEIASRYIRICGEVPAKMPGGTCKNVDTPPGKNVVDNNTSINNTYNIADTSADSLIPEVIKEMEKIDIKNKTYYGNKTQRAAVKFLVDNYSFEKVVEMINIISENRHRIFNVPTSPVMLRDNWVRIISEQAYKINQIKSKRPQVLYTE